LEGRDLSMWLMEELQKSFGFRSAIAAIGYGT